MAKPKDKQPWFKFYPQDWRGDAKLRMCSVGARGLWAEMLCVMHEADPYGFLLNNGNTVTSRQMAALAGISQGECMKYMLELASAGVYSIDDNKVIYSRRMVRDRAKAEKARDDGLDGGNPYIRRGTVPKDQRSRPYKRTDAPQKTLRIFQKSDGKCHWCDVDLIFQPDGTAKNGFHVDHVLPICDGGTNDEDNLVAACADCNHKRARLSNPTVTTVGVGNDSDPKPHIPSSISQSSKAAAAALDENGLKQETALKALFVSIRNSLGWSIPNLDQVAVWLVAGIPSGVVSGAVTPIIKRKEDMVSLAYCDGAVREAYAATISGLQVVSIQEFIVEGTMEWACWEQHLRATTGRGSPVTDNRDERGNLRRGWFRPTKVPPGYDEATGERIAPQSEDAA